MKVIVQNLAVPTNASILTNRDLLPGIDCCSTYPNIVTNLNRCSRSTGHDNCPAVKTNQVTEKATLDCDVLTNLQLGTALVEDDRHSLQQEVLSIFNFCHLHNQLKPVTVHTSCLLYSFRISSAYFLTDTFLVRFFSKFSRFELIKFCQYGRALCFRRESPLASRLRPSTLDEVVGQEHIVGKDKLLYRAIKADKLTSVIFYGPPGTGKTTLAKVIANTTRANFTQINATVAGKKDMEQVVKEAQEQLGMYGRKTILFIDEIHRFNKGQQDYLLPFVEDGTIILIGATTENPYFEVNGALLSRSIIFELRALSQDNIRTLILRAVNDCDKGMGNFLRFKF